MVHKWYGRISLTVVCLFLLLICFSAAWGADEEDWSARSEDFVYARLFSTVQRHEQPSAIVVSREPLRLESNDLAKASSYRTVLPGTVASFAELNREPKPLDLSSERLAYWKEAASNFDPNGWDAFSVRIGGPSEEQQQTDNKAVVLQLSRVGQFQDQAFVKYRYAKQGQEPCVGLRLYRFNPKYNSWVFVPAS